MSFSLIFHGDLPKLLHHGWRNIRPISITLSRRASIKDVVESFGLPHTEVGRLEVGGHEVDFSFIVEEDRTLDIFPVLPVWDVLSASLLRPFPLTEITFVVDVNVGKLARLLRMAGFDTLCDRQWNDIKLADISSREKRILLTRDLDLLKRRQVEFGRYVRSANPEEQLEEVIDLFDLDRFVAPFTRCMVCNGQLRKVAKQDIEGLLQPLTRKYYSSFSLCPDCGRIYWPGSHLESMVKIFPSRIQDRVFHR